jgi:hypothetical protein
MIIYCLKRGAMRFFLNNKKRLERCQFLPWAAFERSVPLWSCYKSAVKVYLSVSGISWVEYGVI